MASKPVELPLSSWAPPASPLRIEYSNEVMEEMRARAAGGFYALSRGGVEVAGLLLGSVQRDSIRVLAQLPFEIEYAYGPVFALSPRDLAQLRKLIEDVSNGNLADSAHGKAYRVLGLYISHSRGGMTLSEEESRLVDQLFPHAWQTVLILKPSRASETAATFFVREHSGEMRANQPYGLFVVTPVMGERRARPALSADSSLIALAGAASNASEREAPAGPAQPLSPPAPPRAELPPSAPRLSEEDILARRALPEVPPAPPPLPPPVPAALPAESRASAPAGTENSPAASEMPKTEAREIELLSLPRPLAALVVEPDAPVASPPLPAAPAPPEQPTASVAEPPEWHEEEQPSPRYRATPWLRWAIPSVALVLLLVLGYLVYQALNSVSPTVMFFTRNAGEGPEVIWQLKGLGDARSAVITIETDGETRRIDLIRAGRLSGAYKAPFLKENSRVVLDIQRASGEAIHRVATLVSADSVVDYLSGGLLPDSVPVTAAEPEGATDGSGVATETASGNTPDLALSLRAPEPILATPVENANASLTPAANTSGAPFATVPSAATNAAAAKPLATQREAASGAALPAAGLNRPQTAGPPPSAPSPEAPLQARVTEAPVNARAETQNTGSPRPEAARPESPRPVQTAQLSSPPRANVGSASVPPVSSSATAPTSVVRPPRSVPTLEPPPTAGAPIPGAQPSAAAKPAPARVSAGRSIWTGQLRKNQSLQINGKEVSQGLLTAALPGQPIQVNVLPGELTPRGLVVYTSNPRYRDARNAVEPPGPTNGWNQTTYRYDPARAHSLIVTGTPGAANGWRSVTVQNGDQNTNVIVIDWQAFEP